MYNPVTAAPAFADELDLPILIVIVDDLKYGVMKELHQRFRPEVTATAEDDYYGAHLRGITYERSADLIGGLGRRIDNPERHGAVEPCAPGRACPPLPRSEWPEIIFDVRYGGDDVDASLAPANRRIEASQRHR